MKLPIAAKKRGRYSLALMLTGGEDGEVLVLPDARLTPLRQYRAETDLEGEDRVILPDTGARCKITGAQLKSVKGLNTCACRALAMGKLSLLSEAFTAIVVLNDVCEYDGDERACMAVRYENCALVPDKLNGWELLLAAPGTLGTMYGENYLDFDDSFERGWSYD